VPRPEDDRDEVAVDVPRRVGEQGDVVQVRREVGVVRAARQDGAQRVPGDVVEAAAGDEVLHVGAERVDAADRVGLLHVVREEGDVLRSGVGGLTGPLVTLDDQGVPAEDGREVADAVVHVG